MTNFITSSFADYVEPIDLEKVVSFRKSDYKDKFYIMFNFSKSNSRDFIRWRYITQLARDQEFDKILLHFATNITRTLNVG